MIAIITLIVFIILVLGIIWWHFIGSDSTPANRHQARENTNVELYHEHKAEIEKDFEQGAIDEENYQYLLAELDKSLLQDITEAENATVNVPVNHKKLSILWPVFLSLFILAFSITFYQEHGALEQLSLEKIDVNSEQHQGLSEEEKVFIQQVAQLEEQAKKEKDNSDLWFNLGQAFVGLGNFAGALDAFDQVIRIEGEQADIFGAKAQASYYQAGQTVTPQVQDLINKALSLNPNDASTNILLGMDAFQQQAYQKAIDYWQLTINFNQQTVNVEALQQAISEAENRLNTLDSSALAPSITQNSQANNQQQLTLAVSLSENIQQLLSQGDDKTVFIYAVPTNGARMPVAAVKVMASDLPTTVTLSDEQAMSAQMTLSSVEEVNIIAIVSQAGTPGQRSGDFKAEVKQIATATKKPITLLIDTVIP